MLINADKPQLWKQDIAESVDLFNNWFMDFAPAAFKSSRAIATEQVKQALIHTNDLCGLSPVMVRANPKVIVTLRMATAPPIARDRLIGLAKVDASIIHRLEEGKIPQRLQNENFDAALHRICQIISKLLDTDIFPWLAEGKKPSKQERMRAATIIADRLCGAVANPIVRNAQERRQLTMIEQYLVQHGYVRHSVPAGKSITEMEPGTFAIRAIVVVGRIKKFNIPIDVMVQPRQPRADSIPVMIEAKSAGDFTNTNKRRKEEATKIHQLQDAYGPTCRLILFLCGYFDSGYLGYEAAEGLDWVWEHRIDDLHKLGI